MKIIKVADPITDLLEFNDNLPKHKATVMVYMMKGCPHCDMLSPKWEVVKKILHKEPEFNSVMSADIDSGVSNMLPFPPVMGFPSIKVLKDDTLHEYKGMREVDAILKFLREKVVEDKKAEPILKTVTSPNVELEVLDVAGKKERKSKKSKKHKISKKHRKSKKHKKSKKHRKSKKHKKH